MRRCFPPCILISIFLLFSQSSSAKAPRCDELFNIDKENPNSICHKFEREGQKQNDDKVKGPIVPQQNSILPEQPNLSNFDGAITKEFDTLKSLMERRILSGRNFDQLSKLEQQMVIDLKDIKLKIADADEPACQVYNQKNAYVPTQTNEFRICPGLTHYPAQTLVQTLAHELAHAMDICATQRFRMSEKWKEDLKNKNFGPFSECLAGNGYTRDEIALAAKKFGEDIVNFATNDLDADAKRLRFRAKNNAVQKLLQSLMNCGLLDGPKNIERNFMNFPFRNIMSCSMDAADPYGENPNLSQNKDPDSNLWQGPQCDHFARECFADTLGAQLTDDYIRDKQLQPDATQLPINQFVGMICYDPPEFRLSNPDPHDRMAIVMQFPNIKKMAGCDGHAPPPNCTYEQVMGFGSDSNPTPSQSKKDSRSNKKPGGLFKILDGIF